ncbi:hypothetical protein BWI17_14560 [Betaproteobacteria bacterium GR16-43]|nr:hypothetical protein BWI17_14560 [Betaproteobacteria bacterium GR16-43]
MRTLGLVRGFALACLLAGAPAAFATPEEDGETTWNSKCDTCHGASPSGARANAANAGAVIAAAITNVPTMANAGVTANSTERSNLAAYIESVINTTPMSVSTGYNVTKVQSLSTKVFLNTDNAFTALQTVSAPGKGTVTYDNVNVSFTYNPTTCEFGSDSFTYRARNAGSTLFTSTRTVNMTIGNPPVPNITSSAAKSGQVGVPLTYTITAGNCPTSFSAASLPAGLAVNASTGAITGTPDSFATSNHTLRATNVSGTDTQLTTFTISKGPQAINFPTQTTASRPFSTSTFSILPLASLTASAPATVTSGLAITYTSGSPTICSVSGTTVTMIKSGTCILEANQGGNVNWLAAAEQTENVTITGTVPGAPTVPTSTAGDTQASIGFTPPVNNGGSNITLYTATCTAAAQTTRIGTNSAPPVTVTSLVNGITYACSVTATNATGQGAASSATNVTPQNTPVPPAFTSANSTTFTRNSAGNFSVTRTGTPTPTLSMTGTLPTGVTFTPATGALAGTPALGSNLTYNVTFTATNGSGSVNQPFTLNVDKIAQDITFAQPASPRAYTTAPFAAPATSSSGLTVTVQSTTLAVCTYAGGNVTLLATGTCTLQATQAGNGDFAAAPMIARNIVVQQASQSITFNAQTTPARNFAPGGQFAVSPVATASSGLAVSYGTMTAGVCTVAGTQVTMVAAGTCTIVANQAGDANYSAASPVQQSVTINATPPDAPVIGAATPGSAEASIAFTPPANDGGSPILSYTASCTPGPKTGTNAVSPIVVKTLTNGTPYSCTVYATNAMGNSLNSASVNVTPQGATGSAIWQSTCSGCHGTEPPSGARFNAAGTTPTVLQYVRSTQELMLANPGVQALTTEDLTALAGYIQEQVPPVVATTLPDTPKVVRLTGTIFVNTVSFQQIEIVSQPASGTLSAFPANLRATYTPAPGVTGTFTFTYRGRRNTPSLVLGDIRTGTIHVSASAPVLNVAVTGQGSVTGVGINCPGDCTEVENANENIVLVPVPFPGKVFLAWTGCDSVNEANQCTVNMSSSRNVSATFSGNGGSDFDGNGKADLVWRNNDGSVAVWLMDGFAISSSAQIFPAGTAWQVAHIADLNGDGKSDLVWQNPDGRITVYLMDGTTAVTKQLILPAGGGWTVTQAADLNGDGKADLIFQNTDGTIAAWLMNGAAMTAGQTLLGGGSGWSVTKTGDFDGDGKADLLWTHTDGRVAIWLMDGLVVKSTNQILNGGSGWTVTHVADFDGDGKADLVWQNVDGSIAIWLMNGAVMSSGSGLLNAGTGWSVTRTGDFNGDGKADLFFLHTDGRAAIYLMNGLVPIETTQILNAGGGWSAKRVQDMNGDGKADIVWENVDGSVAIWLMNGTLMTSGSGIMGPATGWTVSGVSP